MVQVGSGCRHRVPKTITKERMLSSKRLSGHSVVPGLRTLPLVQHRSPSSEVSTRAAGRKTGPIPELCKWPCAKLCGQRPLVDGAAAAAARSQGSQPRLPAPQGAGVSWTLGGRTERPGPGPARDSSAAATVRAERGCSGARFHPGAPGHISHLSPGFLTCPAGGGLWDRV